MGCVGFFLFFSDQMDWGFYLLMFRGFYSLEHWSLCDYSYSFFFCQEEQFIFGSVI